MWRRVVAVVVLMMVAAACSVDDRAGPGGTTSDGSGGGPGPVPTVPETFPQATAPARPDGTRIVAVVDGDTLDVRLPDGTVERVRLVGMNTPEDGECGADEAARRLRELVAEGPPRLERDVSDRDQYGRLLRHVVVAGRSVGEVLVAEGLALSRAYPPDTTRQAALDAAQARAQAAGSGMWAPDACGPATRASVVIGDAQPNPPGDESLTPNEEWVEVDNTGSRPVDLTGWVVKDESASHRFEFPNGFRLAPGASVRIHTGCGQASSTDLYWCITGSAVWNNDGDTAFLLDPVGNIADQRPV